MNKESGPDGKKEKPSQSSKTKSEKTVKEPVSSKTSAKESNTKSAGAVSINQESSQDQKSPKPDKSAEKAKTVSKAQEKKAIKSSTEIKTTKDAKPGKADSQQDPKAVKEDKKKPTLSTLKKTKPVEEIKLSGLYAFKAGMSSVYDDKGQHLPVTFLKVSSWYVSQVKNKPKDNYSSVQVANYPLKKIRSKAQQKHLLAAGFEKGARYVREIRQNSVDNVKVGNKLSMESLIKGDIVKIRSVSKGHGFSGVVKRWGFNGGPASHGSKTHRMGGSIGNRTEPARVMPGKKMPGQYGSRQVTVRNVKVVDVLLKEQMVIVKGPVPGARNSLVFVCK